MAKQKKKKIIVFLNNRLFDPVIQSNIMVYLKDLAASEDWPYQLAIITYEDPELPATQAELDHIIPFFAQHNIEWHRLTWHRGTSLKEKVRDIAAGYRTILKLRMRKYRYIITLGSKAGAYGYLCALLTGSRLYLYQYEPHSEYAADNKVWAPDSRQFKFLNYLEWKSAMYAHVISTGTRHMMQRLADWKVRARVFQIRSVVNEQLFRFDENLRRERRRQLGLTDDAPLILYAGKFGDLYYYEEIPAAFSIMLAAFPGAKALVLTLNDVDEIRDLFRRHGIGEDRAHITRAGYSDMPGWLSAADFALVSVPPAPSKKFISNIKVGEYLCCGLPYLIVRGISEDDIFAEENDVGVVVPDFSEASIRNAVPRIRRYLTEDKAILRERCRKNGIKYRGYVVMKPKFERALQALVASSKNPIAE